MLITVCILSSLYYCIMDKGKCELARMRQAGEEEGEERGSGERGRKRERERERERESHI